MINIYYVYYNFYEIDFKYIYCVYIFIFKIKIFK